MIATSKYLQIYKVWKILLNCTILDHHLEKMDKNRLYLGYVIVPFSVCKKLSLSCHCDYFGNVLFCLHHEVRIRINLGCKL